MELQTQIQTQTQTQTHEIFDDHGILMGDHMKALKFMYNLFGTAFQKTTE
jgi:hypothetical protein